MKFEFKKTKDLDNRFDITDVSISGESDSLSDIIESFEEFLRACGFVIDGSLDLVYESEEWPEYETEEHLSEEDISNGVCLDEEST